jgi:hypothetical protein
VPCFIFKNLERKDRKRWGIVFEKEELRFLFYKRTPQYFDKKSLLNEQGRDPLGMI